MRWILRDRSKPEPEQVPVPAPFYKHRPLSLAEFEAFAGKYTTHALPRLRHALAARARRFRWEDPRVMALYDEIHALAAPMVRGPIVPGALAFVVPPSPEKEQAYRLWRLAGKLVFGGELGSATQEAAVRRALRKAVGKLRTPLARRCRALLRRDVLPPGKARMSLYTDAFDRAEYQARREFLWTFLREEARPTLGTRWFASAYAPIPSDQLEAVATTLQRAYPWVPAADPLLPDPHLPGLRPPPLTAEQIADGLIHPEPAAWDTARRFGFASADSLRVSRIRRRHRRPSASRRLRSRCCDSHASEATMTSVQRLYRVRDGADVLAVSVATLRKYILRRTIAVIRVGRAVRIPESELARLQREGLTPRREAARNGAPPRERAPHHATPPTGSEARS